MRSHSSQRAVTTLQKAHTSAPRLENFNTWTGLSNALIGVATDKDVLANTCDQGVLAPFCLCEEMCARRSRTVHFKTVHS